MYKNAIQQRKKKKGENTKSKYMSINTYLQADEYCATKLSFCHCFFMFQWCLFESYQVGYFFGDQFHNGKSDV